MIDPTMNHDEINAVPEWKLAFELSEVDNDLAPIGWSNYITLANHLIKKYYLEEKKISYQMSGEKSVAFKMTSEHFSTLLSGNMVKVTNNSGDIPVEFFMDDIGIHMLEHIFLKKMSELRQKLADSNGIQITPVTEDSFK